MDDTSRDWNVVINGYHTFLREMAEKMNVDWTDIEGLVSEVIYEHQDNNLIGCPFDV